jgi:hypothetical protein
MKTGKKIPLNVDSKFKSHFGTVDSKNLKSIYIQFSTWVEPINESSCWDCVVKSFEKSIKTNVNKYLDLKKFKPKTIVDLDLRSSGIETNKRSFLKCEITLFTNTDLNLKSPLLIGDLNEMTNKLIDCEKHKSEHFNFFSTKS